MPQTQMLFSMLLLVEPLERSPIRKIRAPIQARLRRKIHSTMGGRKMSGNDVFIIDCIVTGVIILGIYLYNKKHDNR